MEKKRVADDHEVEPAVPKRVDRFGFVKQEQNPSEGLTRSRSASEFGRYGVPEPYEKLKELTRGRGVTQDSMREFIRSLDIPGDAKMTLLNLTPHTYVGAAAELAKNIKTTINLVNGDRVLSVKSDKVRLAGLRAYLAPIGMKLARAHSFPNFEIVKMW
ncbi:hypothetical protein ACH5RR_022761 [Cinchona calisaya]|uniref:Adenylosuccinate lyase PurB C-terminal domain-containing protein n=1 Tax=Cinchona calisaya TaxID=153742 RepID=A0ABD2ZAA4_9GENT